MSTDPAPPADPVAEAADLIRAVGTCAQHARRYRALAAPIAEPIFDRALELGSDVRRGARGPEPGPPLAAAIAELRALLARGEAAIAGVRAGAEYRSAAAAFAAGDVAAVARVAPDVFAGVMPRPPGGTLYWPVPLGRRGGGEHFITPGACADRVHRIATDGLSSPEEAPDLGGDDTIRPVMLGEEHDASDSPIALAFDAARLPPLCRLDDGGLALLYAPHVRAPLAVHAVADVGDEWWRIRPDAYRQYLDELGRELGARGLALVVDA